MLNNNNNNINNNNLNNDINNTAITPSFPISPNRTNVKGLNTNDVNGITKFVPVPPKPEYIPAAAAAVDGSQSTIEAAAPVSIPSVIDVAIPVNFPKSAAYPVLKPLKLDKFDIPKADVPLSYTAFPPLIGVEYDVPGTFTE